LTVYNNKYIYNPLIITGEELTMEHHSHIFQENTDRAEIRTKIVMIITAVMMAAEITAGTMFNSMALLADGWHMGTHMTAFLIAVAAYHFSRKYRDNKKFSFGTGKIGVLGGFASSILLLVVSGFMIFESIDRLINPAVIQFGEALVVAVIGLAVNVISAFLLKDSHSHSEGGHHGHGHHHDKNLKAAYIHVVTDAITSVTAIIALLIGLYYGIGWIDSLMGFAGSVVILIWAYNIIKETVIILTDYTPSSTDLVEEITKTVESLSETKISDLHVWQVSSGKYAAIVSIAAKNPKTTAEYHKLINVHEELVHLSVQIIEK